MYIVGRLFYILISHRRPTPLETDNWDRTHF